MASITSMFESLFIYTYGDLSRIDPADLLVAIPCLGSRKIVTVYRNMAENGGPDMVREAESLVYDKLKMRCAREASESIMRCLYGSWYIIDGEMMAPADYIKDRKESWMSANGFASPTC